MGLFIINEAEYKTSHGTTLNNGDIARLITKNANRGHTPMKTITRWTDSNVAAPKSHTAHIYWQDMAHANNKAETIQQGLNRSRNYKNNGFQTRDNKVLHPMHSANYHYLMRKQKEGNKLTGRELKELKKSRKKMVTQRMGRDDYENYQNKMGNPESESPKKYKEYTREVQNTMPSIMRDFNKNRDATVERIHRTTPQVINRHNRNKIKFQESWYDNLFKPIGGYNGYLF